MRVLFFLFVALVLASAGPADAQTAKGKPARGVAYTLPQWFKPSFLDFREDVAEAARRDRHVMVFLHLDGCPYCAKLLAENFERGENSEFIRKHFDVIAVNVRGDLEVTWVDGGRYTERTLTRHLKVTGTPTLVFLGPDGRIVLQVAGYRDPGLVRDVLAYVQSRGYLKEPFTAQPRPMTAASALFP